MLPACPRTSGHGWGGLGCWPRGPLQAHSRRSWGCLFGPHVRLAFPPYPRLQPPVGDLEQVLQGAVDRAQLWTMLAGWWSVSVRCCLNDCRPFQADRTWQHLQVQTTITSFSQIGGLVQPLVAQSWPMGQGWVTVWAAQASLSWSPGTWVVVWGVALALWLGGSSPWPCLLGSLPAP